MQESGTVSRLNIHVAASYSGREDNERNIRGRTDSMFHTRSHSAGQQTQAQTQKQLQLRRTSSAPPFLYQPDRKQIRRQNTTPNAMPKKPKRKPLATLTNNPHRPFTFTYALAQPGLMRTIALRWPKSWRGSLPAKSELPKPKPKPNPKPNPKPLSSASSLRMRYFDENGTSLTVATSSSSVTPWIPPPIYPQLSTSNSAETAETTSSVALNSKTSASTVSKIFSDPLLLLRNLHSDSQTAKRVKFADEENMFLSNDDDDDFNYDKDHYHVVTHDSIDFIYSSNSIGAAKAENDNENENENNDDFVIVREEKIRPTINFRKEKLEAQFLEDSDYDGNGIDEDFDAEEDEDEVDILAAILSYKNVYSLEGENK